MAASTRQPGDSFPDVKKSRHVKATGAVNSDRLVPGATYTAIVQARQGDGTYTVTTEDPAQEVKGVQLATPVMGGLFGLRIRSNLPQYTKVKLAYGTPSFIFCVLPENNLDWLNAKTRSIIWGAPMDPEQGVTENTMSDHAEDLLEGEVELENGFGIALTFLTTLIRMSAEDRAVVECHLINDMVRIISAQYRHISGLGDDLIFDHGRPTMERNWSMYRHEVLGKLTDKEPFADLNGDEVDREKLDERRITGIGRARFREFIGFAGDFIHSFVTDPPAALVSMAADSAGSGAGKSWMHRNSDGSVIIQSVSEIRMERVTRIPVPVRFANHEAKSTTIARQYDSLTEAFLKLPKAAMGSYMGAYHIRSYGRWLARYHSFARMLQLDGEYTMPSEADSPVPDWCNAETDRAQANGIANYPIEEGSEDKVLYYDAYACFVISRDGSITIHDGYGATVLFSNGNIQISAPKHIDIEAAGDIRMVAGGSIMMKARRNVEISAALGGIIFHSYAWLRMLCEKGTVWLRSNAPTDKDEALPPGDPPEALPLSKRPKEAGAPIPDVAGWEKGEKHGYAILIEAAEGHAAYRSEMGTFIAVDGLPADDSDSRYNLAVTCNGELDLRGERRADLRSSKQTRVIAGGSVVISSPILLSDAQEVIVGRNMSSPDIILRDKMLWCRKMYAADLMGAKITGPERGARIPLPDDDITQTLKRHLNHIDTFRNNVAPAAPAAPDASYQAALTQASALKTAPASLPWEGSTDGPLWGFPLATEYAWDNRETVRGSIPETLTQQYLRLDATGDPDRWGGVGYKDWELGITLSGKRLAPHSSFGKFELLYRASDEGENLHVPSGSAPASLGESTVVIEWKPRPAPNTGLVIKALKRDGET